MEIANLIIAILSLFATSAISIIIYKLDRKHEKEIKDKNIQELAKKFIRDNSDERDYLHWATIAAGCYPQNKHVRKIYNEFSLLDDDTKKEVLKQCNLDCEIIENDDWINSKIELIKVCIKKLNLGEDFLYDGGKYFYKSYDHKKEKILNKNECVYENVFKIRNSIFYNNNEKLSYAQYLEDYLYCKKECPSKLPKNLILPNDYLIKIENFGNCEEKKVSFWLMIMILNVKYFSIRYLNLTDKDHSETDAEIETFEDEYFNVLYELYYLENKTEETNNG